MLSTFQLIFDRKIRMNTNAHLINKDLKSTQDLKKLSSLWTSILRQVELS